MSEAIQVDYGPHEAAMQAYREAGTRVAMATPNRGPVTYDASGRVSQAILDAYWKYGFYVFTGVIGEQELAELRSETSAMLANAPAHKGAATDAQGRPALGAAQQARNLIWVRPLSDPSGGTAAAGGRHPAKMYEPTAPDGAPEHVLQLVLGSLQYSDACLRLYGHPDMLAVAAAVNGEDFTPFNEGVWYKHAGLGGSVAWHQDGTMKWDAPDFDGGTHGFNFMAQLYGCDAANGLWVVPGTHEGRADIKAMCDAAGSDRIPGAIPMICEPGDVAICNRQAVHGSFANTSPNIRVTVNFGFNRRASVLNAEGNGIHSPRAVYDEARIARRSAVIAYAINARKAHFPDEQPYCYQPLAEEMDQYPFDDRARQEMNDYNLLDLGI
ncbi:MAG: phytanoyl-CoA dioxygenase family protein [Pseudomonadales bacterium]|nr:phytanoyl-CoA dioxygenase family protein [Pseudomonadales bacterium]